MNSKFVVTVCFLAFASDVHAADIRLFHQRGDSPDSQKIVIEGRIQPGDYEKFVATAKEASGYIEEVFLYTPGGDFVEGMKIGRAMRALRLSARAPLTRECEGESLEFMLKEGFLMDPHNCVCASAGFFMLAGAVFRSGDEIYVHRPFLQPERLAGLSGTQASEVAGLLKKESENYLKDMGLPQSIVDYVWSIPGKDAVKLSPEIRSKYFSLFISEYQDWYNARCPEDTLACATKLNMQLQAEGYKTFFGTAPNVFSRLLAWEAFQVKAHPYRLWVDARSFLGKTLSQFNEATQSRYFRSIKIGPKVIEFYSDKEVDDGSTLQQSQHGPDPSITLRLKNGTIWQVLLRYQVEKENVFQDAVFSGIDESLQKTYGPGQLKGNEFVKMREWNLDGGATLAELFLTTPHDRMLSYRQK
jgi:hypothetical protein